MAKKKLPKPPVAVYSRFGIGDVIWTFGIEKKFTSANASYVEVRGPLTIDKIKISATIEAGFEDTVSVDYHTTSGWTIDEDDAFPSAIEAAKAGNLRLKEE